MFCGIRSPATCWRTAPIFAAYRCWGMRTSHDGHSTPTSSTHGCGRWSSRHNPLARPRRPASHGSDRVMVRCEPGCGSSITEAGAAAGHAMGSHAHLPRLRETDRRAGRQDRRAPPPGKHQRAEHRRRGRPLQTKLETLVRQTYGKLTPWQKAQVARHVDRPHAMGLHPPSGDRLHAAGRRPRLRRGRGDGRRPRAPAWPRLPVPRPGEGRRHGSRLLTTSACRGPKAIARRSG